MAQRVEIEKSFLIDAIEGKLQSLKRAQNTSKNPKMKLVIDEDIRLYTHALNTITEVK